MGRFDIQAPGAMAGDAISKYFADLEQRRRQQMQDQLALDREKRLATHDTEQSELAREQLASLKDLRKQQGDAAAQKSVTDALTLTGIGGGVSPEMAQKAQAAGLGGMVAPAAPANQEVVTPETDPTKQQGIYPGIIASSAPSVGNSAPATAGFSRGTAAERKTAEDKAKREAYLKTLDPASAQAKFLKAQDATGDTSLPYQMFQDRQGRLFVRDGQNKGQLLVQDESGQFRPAGPNDKPFDKNLGDQLVNDDPTNSGGGKSFVIPVQTGNGVIVLDGRTGQPISRYDLKPGDTAQENMTRAKMVLYDIGQIENSFTPDRVGPLMGRYKTMQLALVGEAGDAGLADMQSTISTLQNTVINLRTGAQMSEPEAQRIMKEIPSMNLPPDVFMARLRQAKQYFAEYLNTRSTMAYGRGTVKTDAAGVGMTPAPAVAAPGVVAPGATPPPAPKPRILKVTPVP
jgi:hypothetical protein